MEALLEATLRLAAPLLIAALGELVVERSGLINIGIEGTMLTGAFAGFAVAAATGSPAAGILGAGLAGMGVGVLFATFAVVHRVDQIVVGMAVNLIALGATGLGARALHAANLPPAPTLAVLPVASSKRPSSSRSHSKESMVPSGSNEPEASRDMELPSSPE